MKTLLATFLVSLSSLSIAATEVDGSIFYITPSNDFQSRGVSLEVPSRGQGEVVLRGKRFEWRTTNFWSSQIDGKTEFVAVFKTSFMNFKSLIALKGSYLKASNQIKFYGDLLKKDGHHFSDRNLTGFKYNGGFDFNFTR